MSPTDTTVEHQLLQVPLDQIAPHPRNPRRTVTQIGELAASIEQVGILEPLIVAHWPQQLRQPKNAGDFLLIAGARRLKAAQKAGLDTVPVLVRADLTSLAEQITAMLQENLHRADLSPVEESDSYQGLLDLDLSRADIAARVARPKKVVSERLRLQRLPERVRQDVHTHQVTLTDALALAEFADAPEVMASLVEVLGTSMWRFRLEDQQRARKRQRAQEAEERQARKAGITILDAYPEADDEDALDDEDLATWPYADLDDLYTNEQVDAFVQEHGDDGWPQAVIEDHARSCDGHAAVKRGDGVGLDYVCTTPAAHADAYAAARASSASGSTGTEGVRPPAKKREETPAQKAAREAFEQLTVAATVRRAHVRESLDTFTEEQAREVIKARLLHQLTYPSDVEREFLGLDRSGDGDAVAERARHLARTLSLPGLILLDHAIDSAHIENWLRSPDQWVSKWDTRVRDWQRFLDDVLGYQWSDVEREHLPKDFFDTPADDESDDEGQAS